MDGHEFFVGCVWGLIGACGMWCLCISPNESDGRVFSSEGISWKIGACGWMMGEMRRMFVCCLGGSCG